MTAISFAFELTLSFNRRYSKATSSQSCFCTLCCCKLLHRLIFDRLNQRQNVLQRVCLCGDVSIQCSEVLFFRRVKECPGIQRELCLVNIPTETSLIGKSVPVLEEQNSSMEQALNTVKQMQRAEVLHLLSSSASIDPLVKNSEKDGLERLVIAMLVDIQRCS